MTRVGYLGPEGTFSHEALVTQAGSAGVELVSLPTVYDTVMAVHDGRVDRAFVPIENALEGSVNATLDALAIDATDVKIVGEAIHPIHSCLIAREPIALEAVATVLSHPQAVGQASRFLRERLPQARVIAVNSTADAVRQVAEGTGADAALGTHISAELYGCVVLEAGVEDMPDNETRFVWLHRDGGRPGAEPVFERSAPSAGAEPPFKTSVVFAGADSVKPGWLVTCLSEFASRNVNLTKIESRPTKQGLGRYLFFVDLEGGDHEQHVGDALSGLRDHVDDLNVMGSYPAA